MSHGMDRSHSAALAAAAASLLALAAAASAQNARYTVTDLGTVSGSTVCECFSAQALNEDGQAAVQFFGTDGAYAAMFHDGAGNVDIGSLGGAVTFPRGINDHGAIVGFSDTGAEPQHAFLWHNGIMADLGTLAGPRGNVHEAVHSGAQDINNAFQVVGSSQNRDGWQRPFLWTQADGMVDLGTLGGEFGLAHGINEAGAVVGWAWNAQRRHRPFLWTAVTGMMDLGDLGGNSAVARDVNIHGHAVGSSTTGAIVFAASETRAVLWMTPGDPVNLGTLPNDDGVAGEYGPDLANSTAVAINDAGQIVGYAFPAAILPGAFLYENGVMTSLADLVDDPAWVIQSAADINNAGQILATGRYNGGDPRAVLLTPIVPHDPCPADLNGDAAADIFDLLAYMDAWFALDASAERTGDAPASVDVSDLLTYLDDWFAGC